MGDVDGAIADANSAIDIDADSIAGYLALAEAYARKHGETAALIELNKAAAVEPKGGFDGYRIRAIAHERKHDFNNWMADLDRWVALCPYSAVPYAYRANVYAGSGIAASNATKPTELAIADANKAIAIDPNYEWPYRILGIIHRARSEFDEAINDFTSAIKTDPNKPDDYRLRAGVFVLKSDYDSAILDLSKLIELHADDAEAFRSRANTYALKGDYDHAIQDFSKLIDLHPDDDHAYWSRSLAYEKKHDDAAALADRNRSAEIAKKRARLRNSANR
jgi:tetratricopeptide (TPR) repeat protein